MPLGMGVPKFITVNRRERRVPMEVGVRISGHLSAPGTESTFTENVSSHGARVISTRHWKINDHLTIATLTGSFQALARVAYCRTTPEIGFVVGVEFLRPTGEWVIRGASPSVQ
jgi:PilZ domain